MPQNIGIFGGSFNPIHNGHIALAQSILKQSDLDEIWFMVSPQNPLKQQTDLLDDDVRLALTRKALKDYRGMVVSDAEFHLPVPSYTWKTMAWLSQTYPEKTFSLIIGSDNWLVFNHWAHHQELIHQYHIIIYPRRNADVDPTTLPKNITLLHIPLFDISSTEIRQNVRNGQPIDHLVPRTIAQDVVRLYAID